MNLEPVNENPQLLDNKLLCAAVMESATTAMVLLNQKLEIIYLNSAAEHFLETSCNQLMHQLIHKVPGFNQTLVERLEHILSSNQAYTQREIQWQRSSGALLTLDLTVTPINIPTGTALLLELQRLDRFLKISKEESISSTHQANKALIRGLAHEVKNPLGGIRGAAQLLARAIEDPELTDYTQIIISEADRLRDLVDRMLGPRQPPQLEFLNIHEVLERVKALLDAETGYGIQIERDYDFSLPLIKADMNQLIQAVLNIGRNAVQAIQEAKETAPSIEPTNTTNKIRFISRIARQQTINHKRYRLVIRICIQDNGPGIATDLLETLFYPLVSGRAAGTGLGLAISQAILQQHKGIIECDSSPGNTEFNLFIPLEAT